MVDFYELEFDYISDCHLWCAEQCSDQCVSKPVRPNCGQSSILAPVSAFDAVFTQDLNENLSEMSLLSHPRQFIEPRSFCANNALLRYSVFSQYIELENTERKVLECRKLNVGYIGDYLYTVDIRHFHCSPPFSFFLVEYKRGKKVPWNGRLLKRWGLNIVCGCSSGSFLFGLIQTACKTVWRMKVLK